MIPMFDVLLEAGFAPNSQLISDDPGGLTLSLAHGQSLDAVYCLSKRTFETGLLLSGVLANSRTLQEVEHWLPVLVESREAGLALLAHSIERAVDKAFLPSPPPWWIEEGRTYRMLVPSLRRLAEYEARPRCSVHPGWLGVLLRELRERLPLAPPDAHVHLSFDGQTVFLKVADMLYPALASGRPWPDAYAISVSELAASIPPRRRRGSDWFEIRDEQLYLGVHRLGLASIVEKEPSNTLE